MDECDWTLNQPSCEAHVKSSIHQPKKFGFGWTLGVATCFYMKHPKHPHFRLVCLTFWRDDLLNVFIIVWVVQVWSFDWRFLVRSSNFSHGRVTNYEWMIENEVRTLQFTRGGSNKEIITRGFSTRLWVTKSWHVCMWKSSLEANFLYERLEFNSNLP
jgi:hypothetical protein